MKSCCEIRVRGIVQGVGFRPYVYRTARAFGLSGGVLNDTEGVLIELEGEESAIHAFLEEMRKSPPPLSRIQSIQVEKRNPSGLEGFVIRESRESAVRSASISPDSALCEDCLRELLDRNDRRFGYPFITCTNCGPRFSIVMNIPYDRPYTTMKAFTMCGDCAREYADPLDRRFHTQPNACARCGPSLSLRDREGAVLAVDSREIVRRTLEFLHEGRILAIKGVGGYLLACDATNDAAVAELRARKGRPFKPFALMAGSIEKVEGFLEVSPAERMALLSTERPIVLLKEKKRLMSRQIAPSLSYIGIMLPYAPFQHLLFDSDPEMVLVMTSGNVSEEPIVFRDDDAFRLLGGIADYFVTYNREIVNFCDDSVLFVEDGEAHLIRRSRGYVPLPFTIPPVPVSMLATGGDLKNSFAIARGETAILSQFIGDLASASGNELFRSSIERLKRVYDFTPRTVVCDMHPGYFTTAFADELGSQGLRVIKTQHHHAHIASVLEDAGAEGEVIGIAFDGTGYGPDGHLWGSEFLVAGKKEYSRVAHFSYFELPGGESAIRDVWKVGVSLLHRAFGAQYPLMRRDEGSAAVLEIIQKKIHSPMTCSIGRLFDGISAMLGLSETISTEAEAAQLLEEAALRGGALPPRDDFLIPFTAGSEILISSEELVRYAASLRLKGKTVDEVACAFHHAIARTSIEVARVIRERTGINRVALSGGSFQNRLLLRLVVRGLRENEFDILTPRKIPCNDGCLAMGQIAIAREIIRDDG